MKLMEGDYDAEKFEELMGKMYDEDFYEKEDKVWKTDSDVKDALGGVKDGGGDAVVVDPAGDGDGDLYDRDDYDDAEGEDGHRDQNDAHYPETENGDAYYDEDDAANHHHTQEDKDTSSALDKKLKSKMLDELYKLDYEDVVAGMPTRFKYKEVRANTYGLSTEEILFSRDSTLKQFVSLSQMAPYNHGEEYFPGTKKRKRFREWAKKDVEEMEREAAATEGRREEELDGGTVQEGEGAVQEDEQPKKRKRRRQKKGKKKTDGVGTEKDGAVDKGAKGTNTDTSTPKVSTNQKENTLNSDDIQLECSAKETPAKPKKDCTDTTERSTKPASVKRKKDCPVETKDAKLGSKKATDSKKRLSSGDEKKQKKEKRAKKTKKARTKVQGVTASRLASYGL